MSTKENKMHPETLDDPQAAINSGSICSNRKKFSLDPSNKWINPCPTFCVHFYNHGDPLYFILGKCPTLF